jgi:hypothetical protein
MLQKSFEIRSQSLPGNSRSMGAAAVAARFHSQNPMRAFFTTGILVNTDPVLPLEFFRRTCSCPCRNHTPFCHILYLRPFCQHTPGIFHHIQSPSLLYRIFQMCSGAPGFLHTVECLIISPPQSQACIHSCQQFFATLSSEKFILLTFSYTEYWRCLVSVLD